MSDKLFTPDTMQDGYEEALEYQLAKANITHIVRYRIRLCREALPQVYMRLCYIAHDNPNALHDAVVMFTECHENTYDLRNIHNARTPRFFVEPVRFGDVNGWRYVDHYGFDNESKVYDTKDEAIVKAQELNRLHWQRTSKSEDNL